MLKKSDARFIALFVVIAAAAAAISFLAQSPPGRRTSSPAPVERPTPLQVTNARPTASPSGPAVTATLQRPFLPSVSAQALPSATPEGGLDLGNGLRLVTAFTDSTEAPNLHYLLHVPYLTGGPAAISEPFNQAVSDRVVAEKKALQDGMRTAQLVEKGDLWISYTVSYVSSEFLSVGLAISSYQEPSAHPGNWSYEISYDLRTGRVLALADLFRPGQDYLGLLSQECLKDLEVQGVLEWNDGALPTPENYEHKWSFSPWGLMVTFDTYTVAPGAAGPQSAFVPYEALQGIAAPDGPLDSFLP